LQQHALIAKTNSKKLKRKSGHQNNKRLRSYKSKVERIGANIIAQTAMLKNNKYSKTIQKPIKQRQIKRKPGAWVEVVAEH
jgi:hypothetical protein